MRSKLLTALATALALVCSPAAADRINFIQNGGFETGGFTGWTLFTTSSNGSLGFSPVPDVVSFDVTGRGTSNAARFQVGQVTFNARVPEGGGLMQDVHTSTGNFSFTVGIAVFWQGFSDCPQCVVHEASREPMIWGLGRGCLIGPNLIGLALYCGRIRVLHLEPMGRATRAVGRVLPLRDNPF
jgi:hypothetical protein